MLIDIHGHYTTAPEALGDWRKRQAAGLAPKTSELIISDDEIRDSIEANQLRLMDRARHRPDGLLTPGVVHGPPRRRLRHVRAVGRDLQRALLPRQSALPGPLRTRGDAPAVARRRSRDLRPGTTPLRRGIRRRRPST